MNQHEFRFSFDVYSSISELNEADAALLIKAREISSIAYAPYSHFQVGAAAVLENGEMVVGTNQENASYPVGICAERALLSSLASLFPEMPIVTMAISYSNKNGESNKPVSPCGMCRQALVEYQNRTKKTIRLILSGMQGEVYIVEKADLLLPLNFSGDDLK